MGKLWGQVRGETMGTGPETISHGDRSGDHLSTKSLRPEATRLAFAKLLSLCRLCLHPGLTIHWLGEMPLWRSEDAGCDIELASADAGLRTDYRVFWVRIDAGKGPESERLIGLDC